MPVRHTKGNKGQEEEEEEAGMKGCHSATCDTSISRTPVLRQQLPRTPRTVQLEFQPILL